DFVKRVFQLVNAIGWVDVDEDEPGLGARELRQHPFGVVLRPDTDAVAGFEAERQEAGGERIRPLPQLPIAPAYRLLAHDKGRSVREARGDLVEMDADGLADQR